MKQRLMIALCCLVLLLQLLPVVPMAEAVPAPTSADKGTVSQDLYYCRAQLAARPDGKALCDAYDRIVAGVNECAVEIEINLSEAAFKLVLDATRRDHTEQFWLDTGYVTMSPEGDPSFISSIKPKYLMTGAELADAKAAFEEAVRAILVRVTSDMSQYQMEKTIHDIIATRVDYVTGAAHAHNAYGALVKGQAVCEGYAESLQYLLQRVGIQSVEVLGYGVTDLENGVGENHAWNIVRLDGEYYLTDLTWDDQNANGLISYAYFNQTSEIFAVNHQQWAVGHENAEGSGYTFELPECTATAQNYYVQNNLLVNTYTVQSIGQILRDNNCSAGFFVVSDVDAFVEWYNDNYEALAVVAGAKTPWVASIMRNGREVFIEFSVKCAHKQMQQIEATPATCEKDGNIAYYICQNEDCGKWFTDADATSEILNRETVKVISTGHTWERKEDEAARKEGETYWYTCATCGTISDTLSFGPEPEEAFDFGSIIDFLLASPIILYGGGGSILLIVIIVIIGKARG